MTHLTDLEKQICAHAGVSEAAFAAQKGKRLRIDLAEIASRPRMARSEERRTERAGLLNAHLELDRAHRDHYKAAEAHPGGSDGAPDQELLDAAIRDLKAVNVKDTKATYDRLLDAFLSVARLVNRIAPAYASQKQ
jgi:hypothetical protein